MSVARCGGTYVGQTGLIASPSFPANYGNNENCEWNLQGPTGHFLTLTFLSFNLEANANCNSADYLEIRDINATGQSHWLFRCYVDSAQFYVTLSNMRNHLYLRTWGLGFIVLS